MSTTAEWRDRARRAKTELHALYLAYRDPRVPWYARVVAACVVGYAFSPIDLIPDPIPVFGYLDDVVLIPLGVLLARRLVPPDVLAQCREQAARESAQGARPKNWLAGALVLFVWLFLALAAVIGVARALA